MKWNVGRAAKALAQLLSFCLRLHSSVSGLISMQMLLLCWWGWWLIAYNELKWSWWGRVILWLRSHVCGCACVAGDLGWLDYHPMLPFAHYQRSISWRSLLSFHLCFSSIYLYITFIFIFANDCWTLTPPFAVCTVLSVYFLCKFSITSLQRTF